MSTLTKEIYSCFLKSSTPTIKEKILIHTYKSIYFI